MLLWEPQAAASQPAPLLTPEVPFILHIPCFSGLGYKSDCKELAFLMPGQPCVSGFRLFRVKTDEARWTNGQ